MSKYARKRTERIDSALWVKVRERVRPIWVKDLNLTKGLLLSDEVIGWCLWLLQYDFIMQHPLLGVKQWLTYRRTKIQFLRLVQEVNLMHHGEVIGHDKNQEKIMPIFFEKRSTLMEIIPAAGYEIFTSHFTLYVRDPLEYKIAVRGGEEFEIPVEEYMEVDPNEIKISAAENTNDLNLAKDLRQSEMMYETKTAKFQYEKYEAPVKKTSNFRDLEKRTGVNEPDIVNMDLEELRRQRAADYLKARSLQFQDQIPTTVNANDLRSYAMSKEDGEKYLYPQYDAVDIHSKPDDDDFHAIWIMPDNQIPEKENSSSSSSSSLSSAQIIQVPDNRVTSALEFDSLKGLDFEYEF